MENVKENQDDDPGCSDERIFQELEKIVQERMALQNAKEAESIDLEAEEGDIPLAKLKERLANSETRETNIAIDISIIESEERLFNNETQEADIASNEMLSCNESREADVPLATLEKIADDGTTDGNTRLLEARLIINELDENLSNTKEVLNESESREKSNSIAEDNYSRNDIEIESLSEYQFTLDSPESEELRLDKDEEECNEGNTLKFEAVNDHSDEADDVIWIHYTKDNTPKEFLECAYCPYKSKKLDFIHRHIADTHASVTCYKCKICSYAHPQLSLVIEHISRCHQKVKYQCPECKIKFTTVWNCEGHILIRHPEKSQKLLKTVLDKRESNRIHKKCPFCEFSNNSSTILKRHVERNHPEVVTYKCLYCNFKNVDVDDIADHMKDMHPEESLENNLY